ncbi:MAG: GTPase HflX, partial [Actinobacteria bacterium]|nr:GTPase HflX [Actinomycetota bacterium]
MNLKEIMNLNKNKNFNKNKNLKNVKDNQSRKEKALLIFIRFKNPRYNTWVEKIDFDQNVEELKNLAISAGAEVDGIVIHNQERPNPGHLISIGKLEEIGNLISEKEIDIVIFDEELSPTQQSNLQEKLGVKVIDRTALILDIFAQRAHSSEGKLQVELAQLNYMATRLKGKGVELSRLGGGIGTRGPGETKLEVDRRKIRKRIGQLEKKIQEISVRRDIQRKKREENNVFQISLVGYTNSGKSTLLNATTGANVLTRDMLFSTLDSTTRKLEVLSGYEVLLSDTVGFIEKLPHQLIASFKSTLEEVRRANLLLVVVDISNPNFENHILSVNKVLNEIGVLDTPTLVVFNK